MRYSICFFSFAILCMESLAQKDPKTTEVWSPEPKVVKAGSTVNTAPSDAIILFNGKNAAAWKHQNGDTVKWTMSDNTMVVKGGTGNIETRQKFGDCQLHIEWRTPTEVKGDGQERGNSGIFMMGRYELQILDSYNNRTYSNGQAGSIFKQYPPLVNASKGPGEWQSFDIVFKAPSFNDSGAVQEPARMTVFHNGVLIQNNVTLWGGTKYIGLPTYEKHAAKESIVLQDHSNPMAFRNIWIREL